MRTPVGILALVATVLAFTATPVAAGAYTPLAWCTFNTSNIPGGTVEHRLAITNVWTDMQTGLVGFALFGGNLSNNADSWGYGHTAPGGGEPISLSWTNGPTVGTGQVRYWNLTLQAGFVFTRITDLNTTGTFTNTTGVTTIDCQF
jgi:hypothetical protein